MKRVIIAALPTTAAFGSLLPGIGSIFAFRILVIVTCCLAIIASPGTRYTGPVLKMFRVLCYLWVVAAIVGYIVVPQSEYAAKTMLALLFGIALCLALARVDSELPSTMRRLQTGWVLAFVATAIVGTWELLSGKHLDTFLGSAPDYVRESTHLIGSVFGNPNGYGSFLVTAVAFLFRGFLGASKMALKLVWLCLILTDAFFVVASGSRLSLFALLIQSLLLLFFLKLGQWRALLLGLLGIAGGALLFGAEVSRWLATSVASKYVNAAPSQLLEEISRSGMSGNTRLNLHLDGLWLIWQSGGFGLGPGGFQAGIRSGQAPLPTYGTVDPHNLYLEIATQYGLIILVLFLAWIMYCFRICWRSMRRGHTEDKLVGFTIVVGLVGNSIVALANSTYLTGSVNWVFIGTVVIASMTLNNKRNSVASSMRSELNHGLLTSKGASARGQQ